MSLAEYGYSITNKSKDENWGPTEYQYMYRDSAGGTFGRDNSQASIVYMCDYAYVSQFLDVVMGKTVKVGGGLRRSAAGAVFDPNNGSLVEEHPTCRNFYASTAEVEAIGVRPTYLPGPFWNKAKVTVVFRPPTYNVIGDGVVSSESDRFTTKTTELSAEFQTSLGFFKFVADPNHRVLDITPGQTVANVRKTYTWHSIPVKARSDGQPDLSTPPNSATVNGLVGKLNYYTFDGYPPGTVLLSSWSAKLVLPQVASQGNYYWDISYVTSIRDYGTSLTPFVPGESIGWNYSYDPLNARWDLYTTDGTTSGATMYRYDDLTTLFSVSW